MSSSQSIVTDVAPSGHVATHDVSFGGVAGTIFWTLLVGFIMFLIGFSTIGWQRYSSTSEDQTYWVGLFKNCQCDDVHIYEAEAWFKASKAMFILTFIFLTCALVLCLLYMFVPKVKKSIVLIVCSTFCFTACTFMLVGVSIFGSKTTELAFGNGHQSYSFVLTVVSMIFTFGAAILSLFQMRLSGIV